MSNTDSPKGNPRRVASGETQEQKENRTQVHYNACEEIKQYLISCGYGSMIWTEGEK